MLLLAHVIIFLMYILGFLSLFTLDVGREDHAPIPRVATAEVQGGQRVATDAGGGFQPGRLAFNWALKMFNNGKN